MNSSEHSNITVLLNALERYPERWGSMVTIARQVTQDPSIEYSFLLSAIEIAAIRGCLTDKRAEIRQDIMYQEHQEAVPCR